MMKFMAKQTAKVIPDIVSSIQTTNNVESPHALVESKFDPPKSTFTFKQFNSCNPMPFTGKERATKMLQWFDAIEFTFRHSGCPEHLCTTNVAGIFRTRALDWWTVERNARGDDAAYALTWTELKKLMKYEFCPPHELQQLENEFWNTKQVRSNNIGVTASSSNLDSLEKNTY
ncbi:hypothetical protein Hanom_Chr07g00620671 [Helianthus anomalus]